MDVRDHTELMILIPRRHIMNHPHHEDVNSRRQQQVRTISDMVLESYLLEQTPWIVFDTTVSREIPSSSVYRIHKIHFPFPTSDLPLSIEGIFIRQQNSCLEYAPSVCGGDQASFINTMQKLTSFRTSPRGSGFRSFAVISLIL